MIPKEKYIFSVKLGLIIVLRMNQKINIGIWWWLIEAFNISSYN